VCDAEREEAVMGKTSVRLSLELSKKLQTEAHRLEQLGGQNVTVSELIRACIVEKFPLVSSKMRGEKVAVSELRDEVSQLREYHGLLARDVEHLVKMLSELFPLLATREQVDALTDGIAAVIRALKER
jgi:hypothetical protein